MRSGSRRVRGTNRWKNSLGDFAHGRTTQAAASFPRRTPACYSGAPFYRGARSHGLVWSFLGSDRAAGCRPVSGKFSWLGRDHHDNAKPVVIVSITGIIVVAIRREQIVGIVIVPRSPAQHPWRSSRVTSSAPLSGTGRPARLTEAKFVKYFSTASR